MCFPLALLMAMELATSNATPLPAGTGRFRRTRTTVADPFSSSLTKRRFSLLSKRDEATSLSPMLTIVIIVIVVVGALLAVACRIQIWYTKKRAQAQCTLWLANSPSTPADYVPMPRDSTDEPVENNKTGSPDVSKQGVHVEVSEETQSLVVKEFRVPPPVYKLPADAEDSRHDIGASLPRATRY